MPLWESYKSNDSYWNLIDEMRTIAKTHGKTLAQIAIRWLLQKDIVSSVIIGVTSMSQLEDNMAAATGWKLSDEEMQKLDALSKPQALYPYNHLWDKAGLGSGRNNRFNRESITYTI